MSTATTTAVVEIGDLISSRPDFRGGAPCIAGTGIKVMRIAGWYKLGLSAEEISTQFGLTLAQAYAALAYYHANSQAIDAELEAEGLEYDRLAREYGRNRTEATRREGNEDLILHR